MTLTVRPLVIDADLDRLRAHIARHLRESGRGAERFLPQGPTDRAEPTVDPERLARTIGEAGWQRYWVAEDAQGEVQGHASLKADAFGSSAHRCEFAIGIEHPHRNKGNGRRLTQAVVDFARAQPSLAWVDLRVLGHNEQAIALYTRMGFAESGRVRDRFRVDGEHMDDVHMTMPV